MTSAFVLTYDSLTSTVLSYVERQDAAVTAQLPVAVALAEFDIATKLKLLGQISVAEFNMPLSNTVQKPARWRKTTSMAITVSGVRQPVLLRTYEYVQNYVASGAQAGPPLYYADYDYGHWLVGPTPDQAYPAEVVYYERLNPLSSQNQTNWLTLNAPQAILFGTLLQMQPFIKNDARIAVFQAAYQDALGALKQEDIVRGGDRQAVSIDS
jgi:hypothetical protein